MIRLATADDAAAIAAIYRPIVQTTSISFEIEAPDDEEMRRRISASLPSFPWLVIELPEIAGYAYALPYRTRASYRWSVETSVYVHERFRGRGVGQALYAALFSILSAQGFVTAYAGIALPNVASVALHERTGFERIGVHHRAGYKLGKWHDVGWWERPIRYPDSPPPELIPLDRLQGSSEWRALSMSDSAILLP